MSAFDTLLELASAIPDEDAAVAHFTAIRWKSGAFCPYCHGTKVYTFKDQRTHKCAACGKRFSIKVGTIFEGTKLPLRTWLMAIWLITSHKKGVASTTLARDLGITQKSAWFVLHRLRQAAETGSFQAPLAGTVEVDETFVGGKSKNKHANKRIAGRGTVGKEVVVGAVSRGGSVVARVAKNTDAKTLQGFVREIVSPGVNLLATDEFKAYTGLAGEYPHAFVRHSVGEYVAGNVHTQTIEGYWSQLKRQIYGIHHFVSRKHLSRYVAESSWRYNRRGMTEGSRADSLIAGSNGRLTYKALIA